MRGWVERPIEHKARLSAVLVLRLKPECYNYYSYGTIYLPFYKLLIYCICVGGSKEVSTKVCCMIRTAQKIPLIHPSCATCIQ